MGCDTATDYSGAGWCVDLASRIVLFFRPGGGSGSGVGFLHNDVTCGVGGDNASARGWGARGWAPAAWLVQPLRCLVKLSK